MTYRIEVFDTWGRRIAAYDDVPLIEATRSAPDEADSIRGMLPAGVTDLSPGYRIRVFADGRRFCDAVVTSVEPQWSDTRKLILDRYVAFHEVVAFEAEREANDGNTSVSRMYENRRIGDIVKSAIDNALGSAHYGVAHTAYPDGAVREYEKFLVRKSADNELEIGGIASGDWAGSDRIDASGAYAKDGDTVAGLVVDGAAWPDLRLLMIDSEETSLNSHAIKRHPEVAYWDAARYAASGYKLEADAATASLQQLIDDKGIDFIELNPHRNASGEYDDRVDAYGRHVGLIFGGGECFNAAQVERGLADVYLWKDGAYHVPEMRLKDFYSYAGAHEDTVEAVDTPLTALDVRGGVFEVLTALAYAARGAVWSVSPDLEVGFRRVATPDRVVFFDPASVWVAFGTDAGEIGNLVSFSGHPIPSAFEKTYARDASIDEFGGRLKRLAYYSMSLEEDADRLVEGLLDDIAYPAVTGFVEFLGGDATVRVGDVLEVRDGAVRRLSRVLDGEWGGAFAGRLVGRVRQVTHRFSGKQVATRAWLTSPLRSVGDPLHYIVRSQDSASSLFQFRLDDSAVGLDMGYHLD